ncbi:MAG: hypothetical protein AAGC81_18475 [Pseudomonadota bacterium]
MGPIYDTAVINHYDRALEIARQHDHAQFHPGPHRRRTWRLAAPLALIAVACLLPMLGG